MKNYNNNIKVIAEECGPKGFNIFLDFSGQREFLNYHRYNGPLYKLLEKGITVGEIKRVKPYKILCGLLEKKHIRGSAQLDKTLRHLIMVIDSYMIEREEYQYE